MLLVCGIQWLACTYTCLTLFERLFRARIILNRERDIILKWFSSLYYFLIAYFIISAFSPFPHPWCISLLISDDSLMWSIITLFCRSCYFCSWFFAGLLFLLSSNVLVWAFLYSAKVLLRKKWWTSSVVFCHSGALFWMFIFPYYIVFYISAMNGGSHPAEWTETLCRVHAFRQAFNGFSLSLRTFSCLFHPSLFNVSIVNVHMIGWIKLQRWN